MARVININDISEIQAFSDISQNSIVKILEFATIRELKKGEVLFRSKDSIEHFYAVLSGKVSMFRLSSEGQKRVFFILGKGDLVNEVVFDDLPVSVDCEAFDKTCILQLSKTDFLKIMETDFKLTMNIFNSIGKKQRRLYRQLKNTLPIGIEKKLAAKLWKLSKDYGVMAKDRLISDEWKHIDMSISCTYISYMMGTSRESISRAMKVLQELEACQWIGRDLYVKEDQLLKYYRG